MTPSEFAASGSPSDADSGWTRLRRQVRLTALIPVVLGFLAFVPALGNRFALDDALSRPHNGVLRNVDIAELAAWTSVTRVILNLHETITRR